MHIVLIVVAPELCAETTSRLAWTASERSSTKMRYPGAMQACRWLLVGLVLLGSLSACTSGPSRVDSPSVPPTPPNLTRGYLLVTADSLGEAADELAAYRTAGGFTVRTRRVSELGPQPPTEETLRAAVVEELRALRLSLPEGAPLFVALLGDAPADGEGLAGFPLAQRGANHSEPGTVTTARTDNAYGDLDGDSLPEAAVGRIAVRTLAEARAYLARLRAHEGSYSVGAFNRRLSVYTGQPGFDPATDALIERGVMEALKRISHAYDIVGAYDSPQSPYYYQPFDEKVSELFAQGAIGVTYIGHGSADWTEGLTLDQATRVRSDHRLPVASFFACTNGAYAEQAPSLAEVIVGHEGGPIASIAASDVSHPYGNGVLVYELTRAMLDGAPATVGEALSAAKRAVFEHTDDLRELLDSAARAQVPADEQLVLRREHLSLYNLFGDPAAWLKLPPSVVALSLGPDSSTGSGRIEVRGQIDTLSSGEALVTLEADRDVILGTLAPVDARHPDTATVQANWRRAVDKVVTSATVPIRGGSFSATLRVEESLPAGEYFVKVWAHDENRDGVGFVRVP